MKKFYEVMLADYEGHMKKNMSATGPEGLAAHILITLLTDGTNCYMASKKELRLDLIISIHSLMESNLKSSRRSKD